MLRQADLPGGGPSPSCVKVQVRAGTSGDARPTNAGWASDEPVVVMNPVPMNAGNSWEGKTQGTLTFNRNLRHHLTHHLSVVHRCIFFVFGPSWSKRGPSNPHSSKAP